MESKTRQPELNLFDNPQQGNEELTEANQAIGTSKETGYNANPSEGGRTLTEKTAYAAKGRLHLLYDGAIKRRHYEAGLFKDNPKTIG